MTENCWLGRKESKQTNQHQPGGNGKPVKIQPFHVFLQTNIVRSCDTDRMHISNCWIRNQHFFIIFRKKYFTDWHTALYPLIFKMLGRSLAILKNSKWVWSGNTTITNRRQPRGTARKSRSTITRHQEDKLSKAISSLFPIKMIAILEWTHSNVQQNIEQLQTPTMGVTINKKSTTTEPPP